MGWDEGANKKRGFLFFILFISHLNSKICKFIHTQKLHASLLLSSSSSSSFIALCVYLLCETSFMNYVLFMIWSDSSSFFLLFSFLFRF